MHRQFFGLIASHDASFKCNCSLKRASVEYQDDAMIEQRNLHGGLAAGKAVMKLIGLDCGPVRLPLRALSPADEAALRAGLDAAGFFDHASRL